MNPPVTSGVGNGNKPCVSSPHGATVGCGMARNCIGCLRPVQVGMLGKAELARQCTPGDCHRRHALMAPQVHDWLKGKLPKGSSCCGTSGADHVPARQAERRARCETGTGELAASRPAASKGANKAWTQCIEGRHVNTRRQPRRTFAGHRLWRWRLGPRRRRFRPWRRRMGRFGAGRRRARRRRWGLGAKRRRFGAGRRRTGRRR